MKCNECKYVVFETVNNSKYYYCGNSKSNLYEAYLGLCIEEYKYGCIFGEQESGE